MITNSKIIFINIILSIFITFNINAQNEKTFVSLFIPKTNVTYLDIKQMHINTPNGMNDVRNYRIKIEDKENNIYNCQIIEVSKYIPQMYSDSILKTIIIQFKVDPITNELKLLTNLDSITDIIKKDMKNKSSANYLVDFIYPSLLMEVHYSSYLEIIKDFLNAEVTNLRRDIFIENVGDSIPAIQVDELTKDENLLIIKRNISIDSNTVRNYLYKKNIIDKYKNSDKVTRESIYKSTSPKDFNNFMGHRYDIKIIGQKLGSIYLIDQINYEFRYNLGNEFDRYIIYSITRNDL